MRSDTGSNSGRAAHIEGYPAVLLQLDVVAKRVAREAIVSAWLSLAPRPLGDAYLASVRSPRRRS